MNRDALTGAVEMAGLGPFALLWVGVASFVMSCTAGTDLDEKENIFFAIGYTVLNIILVFIHWNLAPVV